MGDTDITSEGKRLIERWQRAEAEVKAKKAQLNSAECERSNAKNTLAKWLIPPDARTGEIFCVWHGDSLISVDTGALHVGSNDPVITVRTRGKSLG